VPHGEEVHVVGEDVGAGEDDHLVAAVIAAPVQQTGVKGLDEGTTMVRYATHCR
jgi:hypothetical protein